MELQPVNRYPYFWATCLSCNAKIGTINEKLYADPDGCPFRSYYCEECAKTLTPERAELLAEQADFVRRYTA